MLQKKYMPVIGLATLGVNKCVNVYDWVCLTQGVFPQPRPEWAEYKNVNEGMTAVYLTFTSEKLTQ